MKTGLVYLRPSRLAYVRQMGAYEQSIPAAWDRLLAWLDKHGVADKTSRGFGLMRDCPTLVAPEKCRYDACVDLDPMFEERVLHELAAQTLPGGSYLRFRKTGSYEALGAALPKLHETFESPPGLRLDERRPLVTIYLDSPRRWTENGMRADVCMPVSVRSDRRDSDLEAA